MRLPVLVLAAAALTLLENGSALSATEDFDKDMLRSKMASTDVDLHETLDHDGVRRFLRNHDDEERLAGTNMFNIEKLEKALNDASYAKTLFQRWKTHGVDEAKVSGTFTKMKIVRDKNAQELLTDYRAYSNLHSKSNDPALLFDRAKIDAAVADVKSTNDLFSKWKSFGYDADDVFKKFQGMDVRTDDKLYNVYSKYLKWLNTHHPLKYTKKTTVEEFLFDPTRIQKAKSDPDFATSMFAKWKKNGLDSDEVHVKFQDMDHATDNALYKLYKDYFSWLTKNHPTPK